LSNIDSFRLRRASLSNRKPTNSCNHHGIAITYFSSIAANFTIMSDIDILFILLFADAAAKKVARE
jgi:hypothetical protein